MSDISESKTGLLVGNPVYKPFRYPWAYEAWLVQNQVHWLPEEVPLHDDVKDWKLNITDSERNLLTQIFRYFTQQDCEVNNNYMTKYAQVFKPTEVLMMMSGFSNIECVHIAAYSHLLDTVGMPEIEYSAFLNYKEMKDKYDYMQGFDVDNKHNIAKNLAAFGAFTEGLQLFASFAILLNFPRTDLGQVAKMKGMGQIITWSVRDECYVEGTEILTTRGWVDFKDLTDSDRVAQWDAGEVSFVTPSRRVEYDRNEPVILYENDNTLGFCVTPNHDIIYFDEDKNFEVKKKKAETFTPSHEKLIPVAGNKVGGKDALTPLDRVFIAFSVCGNNPDNRTGYLNVTSINKRKIERLNNVLIDADISYTTSVLEDGNMTYRFNAPFEISKRLSESIKLEYISASWGRQFIEELMYWDQCDRGDFDGSKITFNTSLSEDRDLVQAICAISGHPCIVNTSIESHYELRIQKENVIRTDGLRKKIIEYSGKVRCVTVPSGAVIIRYNGRVCVSGNSLHCESIIKLFRTFIQENPEIWTAQLRKEIYIVCAEIVDHEDAFIDLAFEMGPMQGLTAEDVKKYIRYIADRRLTQLGLNVLFQIEKNPLPWLDEMLNGVEHMNFFEGRSTEYSRGATTGTWDEAFADFDIKLPEPLPEQIAGE